MTSLLWLLLPVAAASGWYAARRVADRTEKKRERVLSGEYIRGLNYLLNEQTDRALEIFVQMVDVDSETVETHLILGSLFRRRGEIDRATRIHQNLIARPNLGAEQRASAMMELGKDFLKAGMLDRAEGLFRRQAETGSDRADAWGYLRDIYEQEKEWRKAVWAAGRYGAATGEDQSGRIAHYYCEMGAAAVRVGDYPRAAAMAKKALAVRRGFMRAGLLLGDVAAARGDLREAAIQYARMMEENSDLAVLALDRLREVTARSGERGRYEEVMRRMASRCRSPALLLEYLSTPQEGGGPITAAVREELDRPDVPLSMIAATARALAASGEGGGMVGLLAAALDRHVESLPSFYCTSCGFQARSHFWCCPSCHGWSTICPCEGGHPEQIAAMTEISQ